MEIKFEERAREKKRKKLKNKNGKNEEERNQKTFHAVTLRSFVSFLKTLLEDVSVLSQSHLRSIFRIIFQCTCVAEEPIKNNNDDNSNNNNNSNGRSNNNNNSLEKDTQWSFRPPDDVMILLKKFSGSVNISLRRISIIGYVAYLSELRAFCCSFKVFANSTISGTAEGEGDGEEGRSDSGSIDEGNRSKERRGGNMGDEVEEGGLEEEGIKVLNMMVSSVTDDTAGLVFLVSEGGKR